MFKVYTNTFLISKLLPVLLIIAHLLLAVLEFVGGRKVHASLRVPVIRSLHLATIFKIEQDFTNLLQQIL